MKLVLTDSHKVAQFSSILKNLKNFSGDIEIHINENKLYAQGMDSSHCCLFELELLSSWFTEYENNEVIRLGVNCELLAKIFNMLGENQSIKLEYKIGSDYLYITLSPKDDESGIVREFKLPLMDLESHLMDIPDEDYDADIEMVSCDFTALITQLNTFGTELRVQCDKDIRLTGKGEYGSMNAVMKTEDILYYAIGEDTTIDLNFAIRYINMMVAFGKINKKVQIHITTDMPMKIQYGMDTFMDNNDDDNEDNDNEDNDNEDNDNEDDDNEAVAQKDKNYIRFFLAPKIED